MCCPLHPTEQNTGSENDNTVRQTAGKVPSWRTVTPQTSCSRFWFGSVLTVCDFSAVKLVCTQAWLLCHTCLNEPQQRGKPTRAQFDGIIKVRGGCTRTKIKLKQMQIWTWTVGKRCTESVPRSHQRSVFLQGFWIWNFRNTFKSLILLITPKATTSLCTIRQCRLHCVFK